MENIIRIGTVTDRDESTRRVRILDRETGVTSDWLYCLQRMAPITTGKVDPDQHQHDVYLADWIPKINAVVLAVFIPVHNGDGFVVGEVVG